jgi:hypothetical protein
MRGHASKRFLRCFRRQQVANRMKSATCRRALICMWMILAVGCAPPSTHELASQFLAHRREFIDLRDMIEQDLPPYHGFSVGNDVIGQYWATYDLMRLQKRWRKSDPADDSPDPIDRSLNEVLARTGLTVDKYNKYLTLLQVVGASSVTIVTSGEPHRETVEFLVYRAGFAGSGCGASITWESDGAPRHASPGMEPNIASLESQWFALSRCS